jgi:hypothetical protein
VARPTDRSTREARWPVLIAIIGLGGSSLALPDVLVPGPPWLVPVAIGVLIVPTLVAHATNRHHLDKILGYAISIVVTVALAASLASLLTILPTNSEPPAALLRSAAVLWLTNILVFALWYWRLDAGGPHAREKRSEHTAGAFFFPQMMDGAPVSPGPPWSPNFVDYLFIAFCTSTAFSPTDTPVLSRWAKLLTIVQAMISLLCIAVLASRAVGLL